MIRGLYSMSAGLGSAIVSVAPDGALESSRWNPAADSWFYHRRRLPPLAGQITDWDEYVHVAAGKDRLADGNAFDTDVFAVQPNGSLLLFNLSPGGFEITGPTVLERTLFSSRGFHKAPWDTYVHVFAGSHGSLYAIDREGSLLYYRVVRRNGRRMLESTEATVLIEGSGPGSAWDGVDHASAGPDGALYVVRSDGRLGYYRHMGALDGTNRFATRAETTLEGSWHVAHFFAGDDGDLFGITEAGSLRYAHHPGWQDGGTRVDYGQSAALEDGRTVPNVIDRGWAAHERARQVRLPDGTSLPLFGAARRYRRTSPTELEVTSEYATSHVRTGTGEGLQIRSEMPFAAVFQNMQLFPDRIRDVFSPGIAESLRHLTNAAAVGLVGTAIGVAGVLLGPVGAVTGIVAAIFGGSELVKRKINPIDLGGEVLDAQLYRGAGRKQQLERLVEVLLECPDFVVGLSEMWVPDEAGEVMERVRTKFPYQLYGPHHEPDPLPGGLMILSRLPITAADSLVYRTSLGEDALSSKGVLFARIEDTVDFYVTHLQSDNPKVPIPSAGPGESTADKQEFQASALRTFVEATRNSDLPAVIMGDFNLDAAGGDLARPLSPEELADPAAVQAREERQEKLRNQMAVVDEYLRPDPSFPTHDRLVAFGDAADRGPLAPTNRLPFYHADVPPRGAQTDEEWREAIGLRYGEQIDNVFYAPGRVQRREMAAVSRVQWYVDYDHGQRQLSDHFGIRTYVKELGRLTVERVQGPQSVALRVSRVHCLLESHPHGDPDQLFVRLRAVSGSQEQTVSTSDRDMNRAELYTLTGGPVITLDAPADPVRVTVTPFDEDWPSLDDKLGEGSVEISHAAMLGTTGLPRRATESSPEIVTHHWVGVIRGEEAEYAVELEATATW